MSKLNKFSEILFHEEGILNLRGLRSNIIHIAEKPGEGNTLCNKYLHKFYHKFPLSMEWGFHRCKKCEQRYLNFIQK